jgi:hypothetical protein
MHISNIRSSLTLVTISLSILCASTVFAADWPEGVVERINAIQ